MQFTGRGGKGILGIWLSPYEGGQLYSLPLRGRLSTRGKRATFHALLTAKRWKELRRMVPSVEHEFLGRGPVAVVDVGGIEVGRIKCHLFVILI